MLYAIIAPSEATMPRLTNNPDAAYGFVRQFGVIPNTSVTSLTNLVFHREVGDRVIQFEAVSDESAVGSLRQRLATIGNPSIFVLLSREVGRPGGEVVISNANQQQAEAPAPTPTSAAAPKAPPVQQQA